jgi:hypothetical protein
MTHVNYFSRTRVSYKGIDQPFDLRFLPPERRVSGSSQRKAANIHPRQSRLWERHQGSRTGSSLLPIRTTGDLRQCSQRNTRRGAAGVGTSCHPGGGINDPGRNGSTPGISHPSTPRRHPEPTPRWETGETLLQVKEVMVGACQPTPETRF